MGGVDRQDQLRSYYSIGRKIKKWWRCCFWFLVQTAVINSYIMYKNMPRPPHTPEPMSHFLFHLDIARSLLSGGTVRDRPVGEVQAIAGMATPGTSREHRRVRLPGRKKQCIHSRVKDV
ncbi:PiggyBac transposable element-derived protein 4-like [Plakobranchus ocellatus]|uniref:PiggyBac transposable element-derived protein 4-like n=1 Tax=Plakobranchus ocellatus TaxID=259542 RepID=A0AAV4CGT5_9GAST|nr:PiggyBac transposable element-derived protein 4-like [Plakobranchus ocellatus]